MARQVSLEPGVTPGRGATWMAEALWEAASWVGCDAVRVERVDPLLAGPLQDALGRAR